MKTYLAIEEYELQAVIDYIENNDVYEGLRALTKLMDTAPIIPPSAMKHIAACEEDQ
jgi:hypothetical protein